MEAARCYTCDNDTMAASLPMVPLPPAIVPHPRRRRHRRQRRSGAVPTVINGAEQQFYEACAISPHQRDMQLVQLAPGVTLTRKEGHIRKRPFLPRSQSYRAR